MREIKNLINIIESKHFKHSFYEEFLLTENMQPPSNNKLLVGGGLAVGAGLAANHMLQTNPALKQQLINNAKSVTQSIGNKISGVKNSMEFHSHTHPNLNASADELNAHAVYLKGIANNPAKWNTYSPEEQNLMKTAFNSLRSKIVELEKNGNSISTYSKDLDPKTFDRISTAIERDANDRLAQGIDPGSIKDKITIGGQTIKHVKDGFTHIGTQVKDSVSYGVNNINNSLTSG